VGRVCGVVGGCGAAPCQLQLQLPSFAEGFPTLVIDSARRSPEEKVRIVVVTRPHIMGYPITPKLIRVLLSASRQ